MPHACTNCGHAFPDGSKEMLSGCPECGGNKFRYHPDAVDEGDAAPSDRAPSDPDDEGLPARDRGVVDRATTTVREWVGSRSTPSGPADDTTDPPRPRESVNAETPAGPAPAATDDPVAATGSPTETTADTPAETDTPDAGATTAGDAADTPSVDPDDAPEDTAQADARTGVADPDEIPDPDTVSATDGSPDLAPAEERAAAVAGTDPENAASTEPADPTATPAASNLAQLREELNEQFESIKIVEPGEYELNLMGLYDREEYIISLMEDGRYAIEVPETWRDAEDLPDE